MRYESAAGESMPLLPSAPLGGPRFDRLMLHGIPALALAVTALALIKQEWLPTIIFLDLWLLGYHHVVATYSRTAFDGRSFRKHWGLNLILPAAVLGATFTIAKSGGAIALTTIYLHWQLFHYIRQSEGISKGFASRQGDRSVPSNPMVRATFYAIPVAGFLTMSASAPSTFLGFPIAVIALPFELLVLCWAVAGAISALAVRELLRATKQRHLSREYVHYLASHFAVFFIAYACIREVTLSWLLANIWHNSQYLLFVWHAHQLRFKGDVSREAPMLSTIARPQNVWLYLAGTLTLTVLFYYFIVGFAHEALRASTSLEPLAS